MSKSPERDNPDNWRITNDAGSIGVEHDCPTCGQTYGTIIKTPNKRKPYPARAARDPRQRDPM